MVRKVTKIVLWTVAGIVLLSAILAGVGAWMLMPSRLTGLANRELSKRLNADVTAHNVRLDLFSTYPIARINIDSLTIACRPDSVRTADGKIMADARQLLRTGAVTARLDVRKLLHKDIDLQYAGVDSMRLNLVRFSPARSNWNILPAKIKPVKGLTFAFDTLSLTHGAVRFRDMVSSTDVSLAIDPEASILPQGSDSYHSRIPAKASVSMKGQKYLTDLPLLLEGDTKLTFTPFALSTEDFTVKSGDITSLVTLDMSMNPEIRINAFDWKLSPFGVGELLKLIPASAAPWLSGLRAEAPISGSITLTKPYTVRKGTWPTLTAQVVMPHGSLRYDNPQYGTYSFDDLAFRSIFHLDGADPAASSLQLDELYIRGEDMDVLARADIRAIGDDPEVQGTLRGDISLTRLGHVLPYLQGFNLRGKVTSDTRIGFRMSDIRRGQLDRMLVEGNANLHGLQIENVGDVDRIAAGNMTVKFLGKARSATPKAARGSLFDFDAVVDKFSVLAAGCKAVASSVSLSTTVSDPGTATAANLPNDVPFNITLRAATLSIGDPGDTIRVNLGDAEVSSVISARMLENMQADLYDVRIKGASLSYSGRGTSLGVSGVDARLRAERSGSIPQVSPFATPARWNADSRSLAVLRHSPQMLAVQQSPALTSIMNNWLLSLRVKGRQASVYTDAFPIQNYISDLDISANTDTVTIHSLKSRTGSTVSDVSGRVTNLRQFLTSAQPAPIVMSLRADVDTLQLNRLAAAYVRGYEMKHGPESFAKLLQNTAITPGDSVAFMIPRNIVADIRSTVNVMECLDMPATGITANIRAAGGKVELPSFSASTAFMNISGNAGYDTHDIQNIAANVALGMNDLELSRLYTAFPALTEKVPEIKNLTGRFDIAANMCAPLFPTMYVMTPALRAALRIQADDLYLNQDREIRRITHLMMIHSRDPLHIADLDIRASVFDNMVMLHPFDLNLDRYELRVAGLNNFNGRMFYHMGVKDWPLMFPFGVNVKGTFGHPEIRLGSSTWKDIDATAISGDIMSGMRINLAHRLRHFLYILLDRAARADQTQ